MSAAAPVTAAGSVLAATLTVRRDGAAAPALRGAALAIAPGEVVGLIGASGTGKSTLLHALSGLLPWLWPAAVAGEVRLGDEPLDELDPGQRAHLLATCLDRADAQLFLATPAQELAAARRLYPGPALLAEAVAELGLAPLLDRPTAALSSGERQRVALAAVLAAAPRPLLLDEPTTHLDPPSVAALTRLLMRARALGGAVLVTEHSGWRLGGTVDRWLELADGRLHAAAAPAAPPLPPPPALAAAAPLLTARGLVVERAGRRLLEDVDLELRPGEIVLLSGPNGAGKSTLAEVLAGVRRPRAGRVAHPGTPPVLMLPEPELQLLAATVDRELAPAPAGERARVLRRHGLELLAARAPWRLSRGERQRLVHAALDVLRPAVMVVDEPAQGLHPSDLARLVGLIHVRAAHGRAYLIVSQRAELAAAAHRHLRVEGCRLVAVEG